MIFPEIRTVKLSKLRKIIVCLATIASKTTLRHEDGSERSQKYSRIWGEKKLVKCLWRELPFQNRSSTPSIWHGMSSASFLRFSTSPTQTSWAYRLHAKSTRCLEKKKFRRLSRRATLNEIRKCRTPTVKSPRRTRTGTTILYSEPCLPEVPLSEMK